MSLVIRLDSTPANKKMEPAASFFARAATAAELLIVYACILLYIWRWQRDEPLLWIPLLAFVMLTHVLHHDTFRELGLTLHELRASALIILPLAATIYALIAYNALCHHNK